MEFIDTYRPLSAEEINTAYTNLTVLHNKYLRPMGIVLPAAHSNAMYQLIYLYHFQGMAIHKDAISAFVLSQNPNASGDQQVRHLGAQKGFCVIYNGGTYGGEKVKRGYYCLFTMEKPHPTWAARKYARSVAVETEDFEELKKNYDNCCATCGAREGSIHRYTGLPVKLQKGHCHPDKPLIAGNIIPQCEYCNQNVYKNDFIFTLEGRPESIYNPKYILKSDEEVQRQMYLLLKEKFDKE